MADDSEAKLLKQLEFYFSDSNYPRDKFLRAQAAQNEDGYVPLSVIATFQRMKQLGGTVEAIAAVARRSEALELNKDSSMVKRTKPLPEDDDSLQRSIYSKGWPEDATIEEVEAYFEKYGKVLAVRTRKRLDKQRKDSIFVEFSTREQALAAHADTARPPFKDQPIITKMRPDYHAEKKEERKKRQLESKLKRKEPEASTDAAKPAAATGEAVEPSTEAGDAGEAEEGGDEEAVEAHPVGVVVRITNVGAGTDREALKAVFGQYGKVVYVDFTRDSTDGYVRFEAADEATKAVAGIAESKPEFGGKVPDVSLVEGEAEEEYWKRVREAKKAKSAGGRGGRGGRGRGRGRGRGGNRGGRGGPRGRGGRGGRDRSEDGGSAKRQKTGGDE